MTPRRVLILSIVSIAAALGGVYYYFYDREYVYRFTEAQLQQALSERLPFTKTYLLIFQITLDHARVALVNGSDRVRAGLDIALKGPGTRATIDSNSWSPRSTMMSLPR
jgi:hypothetical protein